MRSCTVCHIRETADYPFPSAEWDLCWNHGTTRTLVLSGRRITQAWDGLCWTTIGDEAGSASVSLFLLLVIPMLIAALAPVMVHAATALRAAGGAL